MTNTEKQTIRNETTQKEIDNLIEKRDKFDKETKTLRQELRQVGIRHTSPLHVKTINDYNTALTIYGQYCVMIEALKTLLVKL